MIDTQKLRETAGNLKPPHLDVAMLLIGAADQYDAQATETDLLRKTLNDMAAGVPSRDAEIAALRAERDAQAAEIARLREAQADTRTGGPRC